MSGSSGLLWGDLMMRLLLKVSDQPTLAEIEQRTDAAAEAFLKLYLVTPGEASFWPGIP
jgi:hypothetical protein